MGDVLYVLEGRRTGSDRFELLDRTGDPDTAGFWCGTLHMEMRCGAYDWTRVLRVHQPKNSMHQLTEVLRERKQ